MAEMIERFTFMVARMCPVDDSDEVYVRESDYAALEKECEQLKIQRDFWVGAHDRRKQDAIDFKSQYDALLERHRRIIEKHEILVKAAEEVTDWMWDEILRYADVQDEKLPQDLKNLEAALAE